MSRPGDVSHVFNDWRQLVENKLFVKTRCVLGGKGKFRVCPVLVMLGTLPRIGIFPQVASTKSNEKRTKAFARSSVARIIPSLTIRSRKTMSQPMLILPLGGEPLVDASSRRAGAGPKSVARKRRRKPLK